MLPKKSKFIKKIIRNADSRGEIISLIDQKTSNISIIKSSAGSIRSNHFHKKDWHYMYILNGKMDYFYKKNNINYQMNLKKGDLVFTPPKELHATFFPVETTMIVASKNPRDKETYERDTVRLDFIDISNIKSIKKNAKKIKL